MFMKALAFAGVMLLLLACGSAARGEQSVSLAWNASPETNVVGYFLYYSDASGDCTKTLSITNRTETTATVPGLQSGTTYTFILTAYDGDGLESEPSAEVSYTVPGAISVSALVTISRLWYSDDLDIAFGVTTTNHIFFILEASEDLQSWTGVWSTNVNQPRFFHYYSDVTSHPYRFFRAVSHIPCDP